MLLEEKAVKLLIRKGKTLSSSESCSGGLLSHRITNIPGSSQVFYLGIVTYDNRAKTKLLGVSKKILKRHGAVSAPVAALMAKNVRKILKTDLGIGITGIAGPTGQTKDKPVGLVHIALSTQNKVIGQKLNLKGSRTAIKNQAVTKALQLIIKTLSR